jgi:prepilin-type processing-associated H-X9-DG protein
LPYIEQENIYNASKCGGGNGGYDTEAPGATVWPPIPNPNGIGPNGVMQNTVKTYQCPSDPTGNSGFDGWTSTGSYVFNGLIFQQDWKGNSNFPASIPDGTSNTIVFTETYAMANGQSLIPTYNGDATLWWWDYNEFQTPSSAGGDCGTVNYYGPAYTPLIKPSPSFCAANTTSWGWGGTLSVCMCRAVSPHTGGINVGMGDGSVRLVNGSVSGTTWFAACTPNGGEVLGNDW